MPHGKAVDAMGTANRGRLIAREVLLQHGAKEVSEEKALNRRVLSIVNGSGERYRIVVKSRKAGTWQGSINDGNPEKSDNHTFWLYIDLAGSSYKFYLVPDAWMRWDILRVHSEYLLRAGGQRIYNPDSTHHSIELDRISHWKNRWDLLGLES